MSDATAADSSHTPAVVSSRLCKLLSLPREIRDGIYDLIYSSDLISVQMDRYVGLVAPPSGNHMNLLYVNKQLSQEAAPVFWKYVMLQIPLRSSRISENGRLDIFSIASGAYKRHQFPVGPSQPRNIEVRVPKLICRVMPKNSGGVRLYLEGRVLAEFILDSLKRSGFYNIKVFQLTFATDDEDGLCLDNALNLPVNSHLDEYRESAIKHISKTLDLPLVIKHYPSHHYYPMWQINDVYTATEKREHFDLDPMAS